MSWVQVGELAAMLTAMLWTLSAVAWTSAGRYVGAIPVCFIRLVLTCGLLVAYGTLTRGRPLPTDANLEQWTVLGLSGVMGFFLSDLCLFKALLLIGPRLTLLIQALMPPLAAIIAWFSLGDGLSQRQWLAMGITLLGVVWVTLERDTKVGGEDKEPQPARPHAWRFGLMLAFVAAVTQAFGTVLSKMGIGQYDAGAATFIRVLGAMAGYLILLTVLGRWRAVRVASRHTKAMTIVTLGSLVGPFAGVILYMIALRHCPAGIVATIVCTTPVLILPFAIFLFRERVSLRAAGGAVISVLGVALFSL
jgi:drug/metabolite transporter (DMT)-like permease